MHSNTLLRIALILSAGTYSATFQTPLRKSSPRKKRGVFRENNEGGKSNFSFVPCMFMAPQGAASESVPQINIPVNDVSMDPLPPPPSSESNKDDDTWRNIRQNYPLWVQNTLIRDSGLVRFASEAILLVGVPSIISTYKEALPNFLALSDVPVWIRRHLYSVFQLDDILEYESFERENTFESIKYGDHPMQVLHLMRPFDSDKKNSIANDERDRLFIFIHGGAWGSGRPWMYRLIARPLLQRHYSVAVLGYRTYPDADVDGQVEDVKLATETILHYSPTFAENDVTIMGHSSGCHIGLLSLLDINFLKRVKIGAFISLSGVFDIVKHFQFETGRGVEEVSPLKPACGGSETSFKQCSPTHLVHDFIKKHGSGILPKMLLVHGALDNVVPYTSTTELSRELQNGICDEPSEQQKIETILLPEEEDHADTVIQFMMGGETRDRVLDWMDAQV